MPTSNLNLPLIDRNMFADVPRDMNALANAIDETVGDNGKIALKIEVKDVRTELTKHTNDTVKHITPTERKGWNDNVSNFNQHILNNDIHITAAERQKWNQIDEVFTDIDNGLTGIANAVTDKGVPTPPKAGFATIIHNISLINTGKKKATGTTQISNTTIVKVTGLSFVPSVVYAYVQTADSHNCRSSYFPLGNSGLIQHQNTLGVQYAQSISLDTSVPGTVTFKCALSNISGNVNWEMYE